MRAHAQLRMQLQAWPIATGLQLIESHFMYEFGIVTQQRRQLQQI